MPFEILARWKEEGGTELHHLQSNAEYVRLPHANNSVSKKSSITLVLSYEQTTQGEWRNSTGSKDKDNLRRILSVDSNALKLMYAVCYVHSMRGAQRVVTSESAGR